MRGKLWTRRRCISTLRRRKLGCIDAIHPYRIDGKVGVFADDTPVLDRGEVRMDGDGAPELQLRSQTAESTTARITIPTIVTDARISLPSCHVKRSWKALGDGDDR